MIPLVYIVREQEFPWPNFIYTYVHEQLVYCAIVQGRKFNINNCIVYDLLHSLTINRPAWAWIYAFQT
jgi:hypothetical protein